MVAVKMVTEQGYSYAEAGRKLDLRDNLIRRWKNQFASEGEQAFRGHGVPLAEDELTRLRAENKRLTMERDIFRGYAVSTRGRRMWGCSRYALTASRMIDAFASTQLIPRAKQ